MTRQHRRGIFKTHRATTATKIRTTSGGGRQHIPATIDPATKAAAAQAAVKNRKDKHHVSR
ncbi:hypothetical protein A5705_04890 [Mycobacterium sp. E787]|nr:hypothetical protein A5705_04890 [Mycobacterium sp. E787]